MSSYFSSRGGGSSIAGGAPLLTPLQQAAAIQATRKKNYKQKPKAQDTEGLIGGLVPDILETAVSQIAKSLINTPVGIYDMGKAVGMDQWDLLRHADFTPERTLGIGEALGRGVVEDFRHPLENPGYLFLDALTLASLGLGGVSKVGRVAASIEKATGGGPATRLLAKGIKLPPSLTDATLGIAAPDTLQAFRDVKASAKGRLQAAVTRRQLKLDQGAKAAELERIRQYTDQTPAPGTTQADFLSQWGRVNPATGRQMFGGTQFAEMELPGMGSYGVKGGEPRATPLGRPEGMVPSGVEAGPHAPLFPRERTAPFDFEHPWYESEVPPAPRTNAGQMTIDDLAPVPRKDIKASEIHPLTGQGLANQQARLDAQVAKQEWKAALEHPPMLEADVGGISDIPFVAGPGGIEAPAMRSVLGAPQQAINPPGITPVVHVPGEGRPIAGPRLEGQPERVVPAPVVAETAVAEQAAETAAKPKREPLAAPDISPGEIHFQLDENKTVHALHDGEPTGITAHRMHKASDTVDATWMVMDGDQVLYKVRQSQLKKQMANAAAEKLNPGVLDRLEAEGHDVAPATSVEEVIDEAPAPAEVAAAEEAAAPTEEAAAPEPAQVMDAVEPEAPKPKMTIEDAPDDYALRATMTDAQLEATGDLPGTYQHVYTAEDGTIAFRNSDKKSEFKVYGADGKELTGAAWAEHKRAATAALRQPAAKRVGEEAGKGKKSSAEDLAELEATIPPELARVGLTYREAGLSERQLGVNPKMVQETFNVSKEQATAITKRIAGPVRKVYQDAQLAKDAGKPWTTNKIRKELRKVLHDELGTELGDKAFGMVVSVKGASEIGPRQMMKIIVKALREPAPRKTIPISTRQLKSKQVDSAVSWMDKSDAVGHIKPREIKTTDLETISENILASNNPMYRAIARAYYGFLQVWDNPYGRKGSGNVANRLLRRKIEFERREVGRMIKAAELAGMTPRMKAEAEAAAKKEPRNLKGTIGGTVDTGNQLAQIGILFLKPAYASANFIGQLMLHLNDHSWNPVNVIQSVKMQREMYGGGELSKSKKASPKARGRSEFVKKIMGEGFVQSTKTGSGLSRRVERVHGGMSAMYSSVLDTPFRDNAFLNEARRQGFTDGHEVAKLIDEAIAGGTESAAFKQAVDIGRRANRNLIDYGRLSGAEKTFIRRVVFFYPWMKGATIYGARYAAEHPLGFGIQASMGKLESEVQAQEVGQVPSYLEGVFKVGERTLPGLGKLPTIMNPQSISIFGTPAQALDVAAGLVTGNPRQSDTLGELFTPAVSAGIAGAFNLDPFTGHKFKPGEGGLQAVWNTIAATPAPLRTLNQIHKAAKIESGKLDPTDILFPASRNEAIGRFLGPGFGAVVGHPLADYTLNTRVARSRALAEQRSMSSKVDAKKALWKDYTQATQVEAAKVGVKVGPDFTKAMAVKAEREANLIAAEAAAGGKLNKFDRLQADLSLLVRMKKITNAQARQFGESYAQESEGSIDSFRRDIGEQYFGQAVLSGYKSYLKDLGVKVPYK